MFIATIWSVPILCFFLVYPWKVVLFQEIYPLFLECPIVGILFIIFSDPLYFCHVRCNPLLLFLILFIWTLFFFFLMSLARSLSVLFILSNNQLSVSLIFSIFYILNFVAFHSDFYYFLLSSYFKFYLLFSF